MFRTEASAPCLARSFSSISSLITPQYSRASSSSILSSTMLMYVHSGASPSTMMASHPAYFSFAPQMPPELEQAIMPVSGDLVQTMYRPVDGAAAPVMGPVM